MITENKKFDLIRRFDEGLSIETGLKLAFLKSLIPGAFVSLTTAIIFGPIGALSFFAVPIALFIDFIARRRRGFHTSILAGYYRSQLRSEFTEPILSLQVYFTNPKFTKTCFRGLYAADLNYGWKYLEKLVEIAMDQDQIHKWELFNEILLFIYQAEEDVKFEEKLAEVAGKLDTKYGISFLLVPLPTHAEEISWEEWNVVTQFTTERQMRHDIGLYDNDGNVIYKAPIRLSNWINVMSGSVIRRYRFRNRYSNDEIVQELISEFRIHRDYIDKLAHIPMPDASELQTDWEFPNPQSESTNGQGK